MNRNRIFATFIFATSLSTLAVAQDAAVPANTPFGNGQRLQRIERRLNVTPALREQAKAILQQERPVLQQLHAGLAREHAEIAAASQSGNFNAATVRTIAAKYAETNANAVVEHEKMHAELVAILTPEQQQKLARLRARFGSSVDERLQTLGNNL